MTIELEAILERNLAEANNGILKRRAYVCLNQLKSEHGLDFFRIANHALYDAIMGHVTRLYDETKKARSFWNLLRNGLKKDTFKMGTVAREVGIDTDRLAGLQKNIREIRNGTVAHIGHQWVHQPKQLYKDHPINWGEIDFALDCAFQVLSAAWQNQGKSFEVPGYDGSDASEIVRIYASTNPNRPILIP